MTASATSSLNRFKYTATLIGTIGILFLAPATANADDNKPSPGGGCSYTDANGYPLPIDNGQNVSVDGKIASCRGGKLVTTTAPKREMVRPPVIKGDVPLLAEP
ncbi:hypothetical protein A5662_17130 [Mycobacteriaceae bacterium 1482268.1]|nr:hypothetical protein A5662_17130 [Mycobacteriaceae bacterium 1482268.1]